jgi:hypothetical protein
MSRVRDSFHAGVDESGAALVMNVTPPTATRTVALAISGPAHDRNAESTSTRTAWSNVGWCARDMVTYGPCGDFQSNVK